MVCCAGCNPPYKTAAKFAGKYLLNMSNEYEIEYIKDDVLTVAVKGWMGGYVLWRRGLSVEAGSESGIYFEYDSQKNGGYNNVHECTVTCDGIHIVLANGNLAHFYFVKGFNRFAELKSGLKTIYHGKESIVEFCI